MINQDNKINILLVDDRPENLLALEAIIERDDYCLIKASSGEEALKCLLKYDFAVILLDVQMPGIDGFATAKIIKAREKTKNIPILFITANNMDSEHIFTGYSIGAIDYLLKPFDPVILKAKVEGFVEMYKMNQRLIQQADILAEKSSELNKSYQELSNITSDLRESEALANVINETSIDSMIIMDQEGFILKANPAVYKMFQYDEEAILGKYIHLLFSCETASKYITSYLEAINRTNDKWGSDLKEVNATRCDGTLFPAEIQMGKRYVTNKYIIACTIRDITKNKQDQDMITHMAYHDGLTNLPNRRLFNEQLNLRLNEAKQNNQLFAILYLDMDRYKYINDSLGHLTGDRLLQQIAMRLSVHVREDDLVARIGGDEFNILLPNTNREDALDIANRLLEAFKSPFYMDSYELYITTSIGISIFPYDGEDSLVLIKNADAALYRAKEQGKNNYKVFHSGMNIQSYRAFILQNDLRKAIERQELMLVYQPRIDIITGAVNSAEALLRWKHPNWGMILPLEFITLAEETGQIVEIGEWVLRTACNQNKAWDEAGLPPIRIAVNFSAQQFLQKDLVENINRTLTENGLSPDRLEIELTESVIMGNEVVVTKAIEQIKQMGIYVSIDDFGTGYSSLNYLRRFPVHALKIDKSFIHDISTNQSSDSSALIGTIIILAQKLNMIVIAEGVETEEQLNVLRKHNCNEIQGYLYCPPVSPREFESYLESLSSERATINKPHKVPYMVVKRQEKQGSQNQDILDAALYRTKEIYAISAREIEVFKLIVDGLSNKEISDKLFISEHTVKNHITHIFQKLDVNDRLQAIALVYQSCLEEGKSFLVQ